MEPVPEIDTPKATILPDGSVVFEPQEADKLNLNLVVISTYLTEQIENCGLK